MNLQEFAEAVKAERLEQAEAIRKSNLEKSQAFLATLTKDNK